MWGGAERRDRWFLRPITLAAPGAQMSRRAGSTVRRPLAFWSPAAHDLLRYLETIGSRRHACSKAMATSSSLPGSTASLVPKAEPWNGVWQGNDVVGLIDWDSRAGECAEAALDQARAI
jgi:hypothetical protein